MNSRVAPAGLEFFCVYTRVSSKSQDDNTSDERQFRECVKYGESLGLTYLEGAWIHDTHTGREFKKRKNVNRVLQLLEEGRVQHVVFDKVDRMSRDQRVLRDLIEEIYEYGGRVTVREERETYTSARKAIQGTKLKGFFAEWERDKIVDRFVEGKLEQFLKGSNVFPVPFGYKSVDQKRDGKKFKVVEVDEHHADNIRSFLREFARVRNQARAIEFAREEGYLNGFGQPYNHNTLRELLRKLDVYAGKTVTQYYDKSKEFSREFTYPVIVDEDLYTRVREAAVLRTRSKDTVTKPFAELVYCAHCGNPAKVHPWKMPKRKDGTQSTTFVYGCKKYNRQKRADYINFGKHVTKECRRTVVLPVVKEALVEFIRGAASWGNDEKYLEEFSRIVYKTHEQYQYIKVLKTKREELKTNAAKINKRIAKLLDMEDGDFKELILQSQMEAKENRLELEKLNEEISTKETEHNRVVRILKDMGIEIDEHLLENLTSGKGVRVNERVFEEWDKAIEAGYVPGTEIEHALYIPEIARRQTKVMLANIINLEYHLEEENWEQVNHLMYRLGLRIYINFNDISKKGGRDKPRSEVRATLEGFGVSGFEPELWDSRNTILEDLHISSNMVFLSLPRIA